MPPVLIDPANRGNYLWPKDPRGGADWAYPFEDTLLPGASRVPIPLMPGQAPPPGYVGDIDTGWSGGPIQIARNDWVDAGGVPVISGSSEYWAWKNYGIRPGSQPAASAARAALTPQAQTPTQPVLPPRSGPSAVESFAANVGQLGQMPSSDLNAKLALLTDFLKSREEKKRATQAQAAYA